MGFVIFALILVLISVVLSVDGQSSQVSKSSGPPAFFLQDPTDGACLAGDHYKRCGLDTLWYVTGKPGLYQIHHRPVDEMDSEEESCFSKAQCHLDETEGKLMNCDHCGAKKWNIVGDAEAGYVLTEDNNKFCVKRTAEGKASVVKCDKGYSALSLQFATKDDIAAMSSDGARLITAASDNDLDAVKSFVGKNVDVNSRDWDNLTALIAASRKGFFPIVKYLVEHGADVDAKDKDSISAVMESAMGGFNNIVTFLGDTGSADLEIPATSGVTPVWLASGAGHGDVVKYLISKGVDVNNKRSDGISALMAACAGGFTDVVEALLKAGADVHTKDKEGLTALISAAENGSVPIVRLLVQYQADVNALSENGFSPLIISSAHGHLEVATLLVDAGALLEPEHPEGVTPLMYAAAGGFPTVVDFLIKKGSNVNLRHKQGGSALIEACTAGNFSTVTVLLEAGADPFIVDNDGVTALMSAASQGHLEVVKLLLTKGLDVNKVANSGGTAIMFAAGGGHNETTRALLEAGADVNVVVQATPEYIEQVAQAIAEGKADVEPHKDGVTALMVAAQGGHFGAVSLLVEAGAVVDIVDDEDMTPLLNAIKGNHAVIASYLVEHGANANDVYTDEKGKAHNLLMDAITVSNLPFAQLLIEKGANVSFADSDGVTVATQAAYLGLTDVVAALVAKGADINTANSEGVNPIIAAASEGHAAVVKVLAEKGSSDVNSKDKDGTNALMASAVRGHKETVVYLLEKGADVNAQNADGHTALMFAYNGKNQVETLLDKYKDFMKKNANDNSTRIIQEAHQTHIDVVNLLIKNGADPDLKDKEGHIALDFDFKPALETAAIAQDGGITPDPRNEL